MRRPGNAAKEIEAMNIEQHILQALATEPGGSRPVTIGDFARRFGVSPVVVLPAARRLVEDGLATPSTVVVHGVPTLHGLLPAVATQPAV
jgi:DNA-binding Lrp family transcriptional regulator